MADLVALILMPVIFVVRLVFYFVLHMVASVFFSLFAKFENGVVVLDEVAEENSELPAACNPWQIFGYSALTSLLLAIGGQLLWWQFWGSLSNGYWCGGIVCFVGLLAAWSAATRIPISM